jgi:ABC-type branched-chain amino acid transport systems, ATPase component
LLVDEPSIGLEPRFIDAVFGILGDLQRNENKTIVMVEQNAKKGLEFSDIGYVLVSGKPALAGKASELLTDPDVGRLFLGGERRCGADRAEPSKSRARTTPSAISADQPIKLIAKWRVEGEARENLRA